MMKAAKSYLNKLGSVLNHCRRGVWQKRHARREKIGVKDRVGKMVGKGKKGK